MRSRLVLGLVLFVSMPTAVSAAVFCVEGAEALPPGDVATLSCFPGADPDSGDLCEPDIGGRICSLSPKIKA